MKLKFAALVPIAVVLAGLVLASTLEKTRQKEALACNPSDFSGTFLTGQYQAMFEGESVTAPVAELPERKQVLGVATGERWIEVDLSEQKLRAHEGDKIFLETSVSSGLPWWPTPTGEFRIWGKFRYTKMEGGRGRNYYYLPNVPFVMYFENDQVPGRRGYGLHGTYWHNDFGRPKSHGCVNLPTPVAEKLYYWTSPVLPEGKRTARSSENSLGTRIVIHE